MSSKFNTFIGSALEELNRESSKHLGDRSQYVGGSDVGQCLRKAVLGKMTEPSHDKKTLLRFLRGHAVQDLFAKIFVAGKATFDEEVEITHPDKPYIKVHIDFLFKGNKRLYVVEMKSVGGIPEEPRSSHLDQISLQMGLLRLVTPPDVSVEGCILYVDINAGEWKVYNGYNIASPEMQALYKESERRAEKIWQSLVANEEPESEPSFLCGYCAFRSSCAVHQLPTVALPADVLAAAKRYQELLAEKKEIEGKLENLKLDILGYTGESFRGTSDGIDIVAVIFEPSVTVDSKKLKAKYPEAYKECTKPKAGYTKLEIKKSAKKPVEAEKKAA
ncbi:hypothetical protein A2G06_16995 (plasmid) [Geobacter anodireducens]|nr:hypothetical protein A2G06_16995 [Geobacter anodireducens]